MISSYLYLGLPNGSSLQFPQPNTCIYFCFFNVSIVESVSSSFDFIALIIFDELFILRSFSMDNQKEKSLIGNKWQKFVLLLFGTYSYTTVASDIISSRLVFFFPRKKTNILI